MNVVANHELDDLYSLLNQNARQNTFPGYSLKNHCITFTKTVKLSENDHKEGDKTMMEKTKQLGIERKTLF